MVSCWLKSSFLFLTELSDSISQCVCGASVFCHCYNNKIVKCYDYELLWERALYKLYIYVSYYYYSNRTFFNLWSACLQVEMLSTGLWFLLQERHWNSCGRRTQMDQSLCLTCAPGREETSSSGWRETSTGLFVLVRTSSPYPSILFVSSLSLRYNHAGGLDVKHQVTYFFLLLCSQLSTSYHLTSSVV